MSLLDPQILIPAAGIIGIVLVLFAETALFFGIILPGDTLLFTAGVFAAKGFISFPLLIIFGIMAAFFGDQVGYLIGRRLGPRIFTREESFFFKKEYLDRTRSFFEKYGVKTIVLARFIPIVRTFTPTLAGAGVMDHKTFTKFNAIGGIAWVLAFSLLGFFFGNIIGNDMRIIWYITGGILVLSFAVGFWQFFVKRS